MGSLGGTGPGKKGEKVGRGGGQTPPISISVRAMFARPSTCIRDNTDPPMNLGKIMTLPGSSESFNANAGVASASAGNSASAHLLINLIVSSFSLRPQGRLPYVALTLTQAACQVLTSQKIICFQWLKSTAAKS